MKQLLRIIHCSSARTWRGGEQQIAYLVEALSRLNHVRQWIFCPKYSALADYCLSNDIPHFTYTKIAAVNPIVAFELKKLCVRLQIDLVHLHDSHSHTSAYISAILGNTTPFILSRRVDFPVQNTIFSKAKYNHHSIKKILCVSHKVKEILAPTIADKSKLAVVHSGIDIPKFNTTNQGILRKELGIAKDIRIVANIAAIAPHKDYLTFINTAAIVLKKHPETIFLIIGGDSGEQAKIEQYIREKQLEMSIRLLGFRKNIPAIFPDLDVLLYTSKEEGLGTTILDALAYGVPVVATKAGGIPEIIQHRENGLLAPIGDAEQLALLVSKVLLNPVLANELVRVGQERVVIFSKESMARKTFKYYQELLV